MSAAHKRQVSHYSICSRPLNSKIKFAIQEHVKNYCVRISVTRKKSPNVYQSCPKMISLEKLKILTPLQKLPKNVGYLGKLIIAKGF